MSYLIRIDRDKCIGCQKCIGVCPRQIFQELSETDETVRSPLILSDRVDDCIECGHCVCICPSGAIISGSLSSENSIKIDLEQLPTFDQISTLVKTRRSIRKYRKEPVLRQHLDQLLELMRWAPSAKNQLPLRWTVVNHWETVHDLARIIVDGLRNDPKYSAMVEEWDSGYDGIHRGAPCLIFASVNNDYPWTQDAVIAVETMDLAATTLGLGACWAGLFILFVAQNKELRQKLGLKEDDRVCGALLLGYPDGEIYDKTPYRPQCSVQFIE